MAAFPNGLLLTRPDYAGVNSDVDIHMEEHLGIVDSKFIYTSQVAPFLDVRTLRGSNRFRLERISSAQVGGRKVGETLEATQYRQEKFDLAVDTILYVRSVMDKFDEWTQNRDYRREYAEDAGSKLALAYDEAALIQAIKTPAFVPPASLGDAFASGVLIDSGVDGEAIDADSAAKLVRAHRKGIEQLTLRNLGAAIYSEAITFVSPRIFTILLEHDKLMNLQFNANTGGNNFVHGRVAMLNGVRVVEAVCMPQAPKTSHPLGANFIVSADEAKRQMVTLLPSKSLLVAQVKPLSAEQWYDPDKKASFMDTYQSYNIGVRRPDTVALVALK